MWLKSSQLGLPYLLVYSFSELLFEAQICTGGFRFQTTVERLTNNIEQY